MLRAAAILALVAAVTGTALLWRQAASPRSTLPLALPAPPLGRAPGSIVVIPGARTPAPPRVHRRVRPVVQPVRTSRAAAPRATRPPVKAVSAQPVATPTAPAQPKPPAPPKSTPPAPTPSPPTPTPTPTPVVTPTPPAPPASPPAVPVAPPERVPAS